MVENSPPALLSSTTLPERLSPEDDLTHTNVPSNALAPYEAPAVPTYLMALYQDCCSHMPSPDIHQWLQQFCITQWDAFAKGKNDYGHSMNTMSAPHVRLPIRRPPQGFKDDRRECLSAERGILVNILRQECRSPCHGSAMLSLSKRRMAQCVGKRIFFQDELFQPQRCISHTWHTQLPRTSRICSPVFCLWPGKWVLVFSRPYWGCATVIDGLCTHSVTLQVP